jgi:Uncharacterised nucleotidyltransferase
VRERDLLSTAQALALDATAAEVVGALGARGIEAILLKGPVVAGWLYADGTPRPYDDIDLLVSPRTLGPAYDVVEGLGFAALVRGPHVLDLEETLNGAGAHPARVWSVLRGRAVPMVVGGAQVLTLDPAARTLHVALHAWWHGPEAGKPLDDLARALALVDDDGWRAAAALAGELHATEGLAAGLALLPEGRALGPRIGVAPAARAPLASASPVARRVAELRRAAGWRARLHALRRAVVPVPGEIKAHHPSAGRGRAALAAAYLRRLARKN